MNETHEHVSCVDMHAGHGYVKNSLYSLELLLNVLILLSRACFCLIPSNSHFVVFRLVSCLCRCLIANKFSLGCGPACVIT